MTVLDQFSVPWRNSGGDTCPPYGVVQVTGWEDHHGSIRVIGAKPATAAKGPLAINGWVQVESGKTGRINLSQWPCWAAFTGANTPAAGEPYGTTAAYELGLFTGADFTCLGAKNTESGLSLILVVPCRQTIWLGTASGTITAGNTGDWTPYFGGTTIGSTRTLRLNWADGAENITTGKELFALWAADSREWKALGAECEA